MSTILGILITALPTMIMAIRFRTEWKLREQQKGYFAAVVGIVALGVYLVSYAVTDAFPWYQSARRFSTLYVWFPISFAMITFPKVSAEYLESYGTVARFGFWGYVRIVGWLGVILMSLRIIMSAGV